MKKTKVIYWIVTGVMVAMMGIGSIFDALNAPEAVAHITRIGYPAYLVPFLGYAKLLAIVAILVPGFYRLKEWAYAGLIIDLVGAMYSHFAFGDSPSAWAPLAIPIILVSLSYVYHHKLRKTADSAVRSRVSVAG